MSWPTVKLGDVTFTTSGGTPKRDNDSYYGGSINWIKSGELSQDLITSSEEFITEEGLKNSSAKLMPPFTVLLAMYGATVGAVSILGIPATTNQAICCIQPFAELNCFYLKAYLKSIKQNLLASRVGGAQPNLNQDLIRNLKIPLPPLAQQKRIAAILDKADEIKRKREQAIAKLDQLAQSIFVEMFGDTIKSNVRIEMRELIKEFRYGTSNKSGAIGYPTLRIPNVAFGSLNLTELKTVEVKEEEFNRLKLIEGDLLFVRTNGNAEYVGRCVVFNPVDVANTGFDAEKYIYASYLIRARLKSTSVLSIVIQEFLSTAEGKRALKARCKTSAGQFNINTEGLGSLPIPNFPMHLQELFIILKKSIEQQKIVRQKALEKHNQLFASLQNQAFTGQL